MKTEREWWEIEILAARTIEKYAALKRKKKNVRELGVSLVDFLRQWNKRQGGNFELSPQDEDYILLTLGERATKKSTNDKTVLLIGAATEPLLNLRARAQYANDNGARHVFVFSSSMLDSGQYPLLEEACQAFFFANAYAGGEQSLRAGQKGFVLRTVSPPSELDCTQQFVAFA